MVSVVGGNSAFRLRVFIDCARRREREREREKERERGEGEREREIVID